MTKSRRQPIAFATTSKRSAVAGVYLDSVSLGCMALPARNILYERERSEHQNKNPEREFFAAFSISCQIGRAVRLNYRHVA